MNISQVLTKYYNELYDMLREKEALISECKTDEDLLQDVCLMALKVWKDKEITEEEGKAYLVKSLLMALKFKHHKRDKNTTYIGDLPQYWDVADVSED